MKSAASSRFWGVSWNLQTKKWRVDYLDANDKVRTIGFYNDEEEAARAYNAAIRRAGLQGKRNVNAVDATGALVPRVRHTSKPRDRSAVVAPDPARDPTETTSKFWGVSWNKGMGRWLARYKDATGKTRNIGYYDTQEAAAHAVNATIRRAGLEGKRRTNPVVDGRLVPKKRKANGHGPPRKSRKRRHEEPAVAPAATRRDRRPRRAVDYDESGVEEESPVDSDDEVIWDSARARPPAEIEAEALRMDATAAAEAHNEYLIGIGIAFDDDSDSD